MCGRSVRTSFPRLLERLHGEQRYRVFADIEGISGRFSAARWRPSDGTVTEITVWCSNDYLGIGQHPEVVSNLLPVLHHLGLDDALHAETGAKRSTAFLR